MDEINVEKLIYEISQCSEIWDTSDINYKDRNKKRDAWEKVCCAMVEDFQIKSKEEKLVIGKFIIIITIIIIIINL